RVWSRALQNPSPLTATGSDGKATPVNLAYAQARVYNPTAWDLWTQDWCVKLVPAEHPLDANATEDQLSADLERYQAFDSSLTMEQLAPIRTLYSRMPQDRGMLEEFLNH